MTLNLQSAPERYAKVPINIEALSGSAEVRPEDFRAEVVSQPKDETGARATVTAETIEVEGQPPRTQLYVNFIPGPTKGDYTFRLSDATPIDDDRLIRFGNTDDEVADVAYKVTEETRLRATFGPADYRLQSELPAA